MSRSPTPPAHGRVIFINRFYWPEEPATAQLLGDLAEGLASRGLSICVLTSRPRTTAAAPREIRHGVDIRRLPGLRLGVDHLAARAVDFLAFQSLALLWLLKNLRPADTVVCLTDPPLLGIGVARLVRLRRARLIHWVQDIYPEIAIELTGRRSARHLIPWRDAAWRTAERCVTLGADMRHLLVEHGVPPEQVVVIPNWAPAGVEPQAPSVATALRQEWGLVGKFVVGYSGNLGRVHDLWPVLDIAAQLRDTPEIAFLFIGGGAQRKALVDAAHARGLTNVQFRPALPRSALNLGLALPDLHLVTLLPGCERLVFPSKFYGVCAASRPLLFIGPPHCDLARIVREHLLGHTFARTQTDAAAGALRALARSPTDATRFGQAAWAYGVENASRERALARWIAVLSDNRSTSSTG